MDKIIEKFEIIHQQPCKHINKSWRQNAFRCLHPLPYKKKNRVKNSRKGIEESTILIITDSKSQLTHTISNHSNFKNSML